MLPDIRVEEEGEEFLINTETDNQLNYAIKLLCWLKFNENKKQLPLRIGVGIALLNHENKIFVGKRIDNPKIHGKCHKVELMKMKIFYKLQKENLRKKLT